MIPILFESTATSFTSYGVGALSDAISCVVEEHRNGSYELTMQYPITGVHFDDISMRSLIVAKPNYLDDPQPFRVYKITKPINGVCTIYARHWSYDLSDIPVQPFTAAGIQSAMNGLISNAMFDISAWSFTTTRTTASNFKVDVPSSVRSWFGGKAGSLLDIYGGEWHYDGRICSLENSRGSDRGVTIRYGVNLTELKQEENCAECYTGVLAYWKDLDGNLVQGTIQNVSGTFNYTRILVLDCSEDFDTAPTTAQLNAKATAYITNNNVGIPKVNLTLNFVMLQGLLNRVDLCDTVTVVFEKLGIQATAKCIRVKWNTLLDRYEEVELGDPKSELTEAIIRANTEASEAVKQVKLTKNDLESDIETAVERVTGNLGGYVILHDSDGDGHPDELLIMDTDDITTATNVWRWNKNGLMHASSYTGTYSNAAITADGQIVADAITTGTLRGIEIISDDGTNVVDIVNGKITTTRANAGRTETTNYNYRVYNPDGDLMTNLTLLAATAEGYQAGALTIDSTDELTQAVLTAAQEYGGYIRLRKGTAVGLAAYADVSGLGGALTLYWENGVPKIYLGTISAGSGSLVVDEPVIAFREKDGSGSSWYGSHRAYINDGTEQGFVVHGHTSGHGITVDFPVSGRIDFFVDTTYVGYVSLASSDETTKKGIKPIAQKYKDAVASVDLKNFHFDFDNEVLSGANTLLRFGAVAQDVIKALEAQGIDPTESELIDTVGEGDEQRYVINYIPFLTARLAAAEDRIKALEERIAALEGRLTWK